MPTVNNPPRPWMKKAAKPVAKNQGGERANRDVYDTSRWRKIRRLYLDQHPQCIECEKKGRLTLATVVDHVKPINDGGDAWDEANYASLCESCHNRKRNSERRDRR